LFQRFSAYCKVHGGILPKRNMRSKQQAIGVIMLSQTEASRRIGDHDVEVRRRPYKLWLVSTIVLIAVAAVFLSGVWSRVRARTALKAETAQMARPAVSVVSPKRTAPADEIILPGNVQPFITSPIYARTNGYLRKWYFDIGAHVKQGQLLAVIETPEVDQQLEQSLSNLNTAKANLALAETTKNRYQGLLKDNAVSQQMVDNAVGSYNANKATVDANQANVKQLQALQSFEKIYAPFDGVITARNTDIGDLINSGSSGGVKTDLFHIAQPGTLRVYVNVPEEYSQGVKTGMTADLSLAEFPGRKFQGKLVRTSDDINMTTRTLLVEIDVDNPAGTLLTGSYAEVHLAVPSQASTYLLPVNTLIFRSEGLRVGIVKDGKVVLTAVTPGRDFGNEIEIVSGLKPDDQVIINPPDSIVSGQEVQIVQATLPGDIA
jgi:RND family efflux transporter MFP subunit